YDPSLRQTLCIRNLDLDPRPTNGELSYAIAARLRRLKPQPQRLGVGTIDRKETSSIKMAVQSVFEYHLRPASPASLLKMLVLVLLGSQLSLASSTARPTRKIAFAPPLLASARHNKAVRRRTPHLMAVDDAASSLLGAASNNILAVATDVATTPSVDILDVSDNLQIEQLSPATTLFVFVVGVVPFIWATYEFWRRIAVGASFGTGSDSVVIPSPFEEEEGGDQISIGEDGNPSSSRGRRTLDRGALTVAYVLFAVAGGSVAIALASVLMGPQAQPM
ncbi:hypothetical protein ACHAWF_000735, partial [Thalassiosira exigua]